MRKDYLLGILFFSSLWGASEAILGGFLYRNQIAYSSVMLTAVAFIILTIARVYIPWKYSATCMGFMAMFYKFLNTPFFGCHLLAIFLLGLSYDLVFNLIKIKNKAILAILTTYLGYILFALSITYIFRYHYWIEGGFIKIIHYVGISGSLAAIVNSIIVPVSFDLGANLKRRLKNPFGLKFRLTTSSIYVITITLWFLSIIKWF